MAQPDIKAILFDCFGVLYVDSSHLFYQTNVENYDELWPDLMALNKQFDYGFISQSELNHAVADLSGLSLSFITQHINGTHVRNEPLMEYVADLRRNYKVGMISNIGSDGMDQFFAQEERERLFDVVVLSGEEGITKPHPRIYQIAAEKLGLKPSQCIMIDDLEDNCAGADAAGMRAVYYRDTEQAKREIELELKK